MKPSREEAGGKAGNASENGPLSPLSVGPLEKTASSMFHGANVKPVPLQIRYVLFVPSEIDINE